jgi:hypothetical protein
MRQLAISICLVSLGIAISACGDDGAQCGKTAPPVLVASGDFALSTPTQFGQLIQGAPDGASLEVDREARIATLTYRLEDGSTVVETYEMVDPVSSGPQLTLE